MFRQVFIALEYNCVPGDNPAFIIDCGANVGYASAYFLTRFPNAVVMAVEPDPDNFVQLSRNLAPYGARAQVVHGAVWSHATRLSMAPRDYRGGEEWARQVCEGGDEVTAYDVASLLRMAGRNRADILKIDIEGAESIVFASGTEAWIDRVDVIAIELHDDTIFGPASEIVGRATAGFRADLSGELTVYRRHEQSR